MADPEDGFLTRWSHRKRDVRHDTDSPDAGADQPVPAAPAAGDAVTEAPSHKDEIVEQLPDIDSLDAHSDFSVFLQQGVPEELRNRALRKLWRVNPLFAHLDGLDDYAEDYTDVPAVIKELKTIYQVGKGMVDPDDPETTPETADDAASIEEAQTADTLSQDRTVEAPEESSVGPAADDGEVIDAVADIGVEPPDAAPTRVAAEPAVPAPKTSAAERRWGRFKS